MLVVGPGLGKSRVWAVMVYMLQNSEFKKFKVYFTDQVLAEREKPALEKLKALDIEVSYASKESIG